MNNCCYNCENLEYNAGYAYPYRCLKNRPERFSRLQLEQIVLELWKTGGCDDYKEMEER